MYDSLKSRLASLLSRPRSLKPQTERQLGQHMAEHSLSTPGFLLCACHVLEEYELDILFGPMFTPTLDERAELSDLLLDWQPDSEDRHLRHLVWYDQISLGCLPDGCDGYARGDFFQE